MQYQTFAYVYDEVMDQNLYQAWLDFTLRHTKPAYNASLLELACGTGALAVQLAQAGYQVTALDLSEEMLTVAADRAISENVQVQFVAGDMGDLSEVGRYQIVTCFSDSLCYMEDREAVQQVFDEVWQVLEPGGLFLFDVHSIHQMDDIFPEYSYHYQTDHFAFLWDSYPGECSHSVEHLLTFFIAEEEPDCFIRYDELHHERTYPLDDYQRMLENSGFSNIQVSADFTDQEPTDTSLRWFFVCQK